MDHSAIIKDIKQKKFKPIYLLHGEEDYFIDLICDALEENVLEEHEKDFNMNVVYGLDAELESLVADARSYPMMAEKRLVILKEAQKFSDFLRLESYCSSPTDSTVFVICYKHKKVTKSTKIYKACDKNGVTFLSDPLKDFLVPNYIEKMAQSKGYKISEKAVKLLAENIGSDLSRINNEVNKLTILVEKGSTINEVHIEENIGISKDYNVFELGNAITQRNVPQAMKIADHMSKNLKANPLILVIASLFRMHSQWMRLHFLSGDNMAKARALKTTPKSIYHIEKGLKLYPPKKISRNIDLLHEYDLKSKGVNNSSYDDGELMRELVFKIMH